MSTPCPICSKAADAKYMPFCSKRCADIDLGRWLNGSYAIPGAPAEEEEDGLSSPSEPGSDDPRRTH